MIDTNQYNKILEMKIRSEEDEFKLRKFKMFQLYNLEDQSHVLSGENL